MNKKISKNSENYANANAYTGTSRKAASRKIKTRERILKVASLIFAEKGFDGTSIRMICTKAGVNIASINYYFKSKERLYFEAYRFINEDTRKEMSWILGDPMPFAGFDVWEDEFRRILLKVLSVGMANDEPGVCRRRLISMEMTHPSKCLPLLMDTFYAPLRIYLKKFLRTAAPDVDDLTVTIWVSFIMNQVLGFIRLVPPWDKIVCPPGIAFDVWMKRAVDDIIRIARIFIEHESKKTQQDSVQHTQE